MISKQAEANKSLATELLACNIIETWLKKQEQKDLHYVIEFDLAGFEKESNKPFHQRYKIGDSSV